MFKRKNRKEKSPLAFYLGDLKKASLYNNQFIDLYQVTGIAPTYTFPPAKRTWENVIMNWWHLRTLPFRVNYEYILGGQYGLQDMVAVNQLFLLKEAELYKDWIDDIYPEENTRITKVEYPAKGLRVHAIDFDGEKGSLWSAHPFWHYSIRICYYIDTRNCKKLN